MLRHILNNALKIKVYLYLFSFCFHQVLNLNPSLLTLSLLVAGKFAKLISF